MFSSLLPHWLGADAYQLQALFDENLSGLLAQGRARDILIAREAVKIHFGQNIAKGIVGEAKEQVMRSGHLPLEIEADIGQRLAGDRQNLRIAEVDEVQPR